MVAGPRQNKVGFSLSLSLTIFVSAHCLCVLADCGGGFHDWDWSEMTYGGTPETRYLGSSPELPHLGVAAGRTTACGRFQGPHQALTGVSQPLECPNQWWQW
ncbi:hypothetical protein Sjap_009000 [Stephania japonica]|uniref:Secreted protein n=1 Tax=Stephania japonica TaxID=461633 RepID=A0AAP0JRD4_9MAGN